MDGNAIFEFSTGKLGTHDLGVVAQMATKLAVMKDGAVVETSDDPAAFFRAPAHPYSRTLVREARRMALDCGR